ncbi:aspartate/glutamate racemase family protein [Roseomonas aerophila]|uniref:Aspartate/glutamate racemase family protein n=1 Tax=Teichococcus aerophilus TaxID=1224513 RepID=A0ABR7RR40_9PROT|nr:aspartate/glutamate racemase family protein [Pseudoroseomonas aerophila]MBC9209074.1 aspartate/glutamate racemase family protein [Pseudoroseomonas aerophila]
MRILLLNGNTDTAMTARMAALADTALPRLGLPAVTLVAATARFGARYIASRAAAAIAGHAVLEAVAQHQGQVDAVAIACFGDPGLAAAREISAVPVTGMADASLDLALEMAPRVALLTGGTAWVPMLEEFCLLRGLGRDRVRVHAVTPTGDMIAREPERALGLLADAAAQAVAQGAGVVVLGGAGLAGLVPRLQPLVAVPVLDSLECLLQVAAQPGRRQPAPPPGPAPTLGLAEALAHCLEHPRRAEGS